MHNQLLHNHWYPAENFRGRVEQPCLPKGLAWTSTNSIYFTTQKRIGALERFIACGPWQFEYNGTMVFSGIELCWLYLLGILVHAHVASTHADLVHLTTERIKSGLRFCRYVFPTAAHSDRFTYVGPLP